jgi:hypothetical protein
MANKVGWLDGDGSATSNRINLAIVECFWKDESVLSALRVWARFSPRTASDCTGAKPRWFCSSLFVASDEVPTTFCCLGAGNVSARSAEVIVGCWCRGFILMWEWESELVEGATFEPEIAIPSREPVRLKSILERPQAGAVGLCRIDWGLSPARDVVAKMLRQWHFAKFDGGPCKRSETLVVIVLDPPRKRGSELKYSDWKIGGGPVAESESPSLSSCSECDNDFSMICMIGPVGAITHIEC